MPAQAFQDALMPSLGHHMRAVTVWSRNAAGIHDRPGHRGRCARLGGGLNAGDKGDSD